MIKSKQDLISYYFDNPKEDGVDIELSGVKVKYFYFNDEITIKTDKNQVLNGCLLEGEGFVSYMKKNNEFHQFDFFYLPLNDECTIIPKSKINKICLMYSPIEDQKLVEFEIQQYDKRFFLPRGEHSSSKKMSTYRTVWTAVKNGYFMSGFTNIPNDSLREGAITSVNLEENRDGNTEIYPHVHPENPELYIACIDDEKYSITQYLINTDGISVCKDLSNGDGLFFPGEYGHSNFVRPTYKTLKYCMYLWMIPTFGKSESINPITLKK
jgi:hypothetical protein